MFRKVRPGTKSRLTTVDHSETYGAHILEKISRDLDILKCLDLGCGDGRDLQIIRENNTESKLFGVDFDKRNSQKLKKLGIEPFKVNIENQELPFENESLDFVIANQILEHTKEIYWINHEIFRVLKVGGYMYLGVPNILALHNRILGLFGVHPTSSKLISAHVRGFSKRDTYLFYREVAKNVVQIQKFYGSQFYPFPKLIARFLANIFPSLAVTNFYLIKKINPYKGEFLTWLSTTVLETNYYAGENKQG